MALKMASRGKATTEPRTSTDDLSRGGLDEFWWIIRGGTLSRYGIYRWGTPPRSTWSSRSWIVTAISAEIKVFHLRNAITAISRNSNNLLTFLFSSSTFLIHLLSLSFFRNEAGCRSKCKISSRFEWSNRRAAWPGWINHWKRRIQDGRG